MALPKRAERSLSLPDGGLGSSGGKEVEPMRTDNDVCPACGVSCQRPGGCDCDDC